MSPTEKSLVGEKPQPVAAPLSLKEVAELLVKHYGFIEGKFDLMVEYQIGGGLIGPTPDQRVPGMMVGVSRLGLTKSVQSGGPLTVDAAVVNPKRTKGKP